MQNALTFLFEAITFLAVIYLTVYFLDLLYISRKYHSKAKSLDWENQFQVHRLITEVIHDNKLNPSLRKSFLESLIEDCKDHNHYSLIPVIKKAISHHK